MTRKKVKLAFIENHAQRKATYNKRKGGIIKKLTEITTLCDVKACAVIYSPFDPNHVAWPSEEEARRVAVMFKTRPEIERNKKMVDQQAHLKQRIDKNKDSVKKIMTETKELEMEQVLSQSFLGPWTMNISDFNNLGFMADQYLSKIMGNIKIQHESGSGIAESSNPVATASEGTASTMVVASTRAPMAPIQEVGGSSLSSAAFYRPVQQQAPYFQHPLSAPIKEVGGSSSSSPAFYRPQPQFQHPLSARTYEVGGSSLFPATFYCPDQPQPQFQHPFSAPIQEVGGSSLSSAAFYRPTQQQLQYQNPPLTPHVGQSQNLNPSVNDNQNQQPWYMSMKFHHAQLRNADNNQQQHQPQPHQQTTGDSTSSTTAPSPNNDVSPTNPNPTNDI